MWLCISAASVGASEKRRPEGSNPGVSFSTGIHPFASRCPRVRVPSPAVVDLKACKMECSRRERSRGPSKLFPICITARAVQPTTLRYREAHRTYSRFSTAVAYSCARGASGHREPSTHQRQLQRLQRRIKHLQYRSRAGDNQLHIYSSFGRVAYRNDGFQQHIARSNRDAMVFEPPEACPPAGVSICRFRLRIARSGCARIRIRHTRQFRWFLGRNGSK
jgi:hypothetical protein